MNWFITRIELHGEPGRDVYEHLHKVMESKYFYRTITDATGKHHLPTATYFSKSLNLNSAAVRGLATQAVNSIGRTGIVFVSQITEWSALGLKPAI